MTATNLGQATVEEKPEDPAPEAQHIKVRFCLFFDGTLNNRTNINQRLLASSDAKLTTEERKAAAELRPKATTQDIADARETYKDHGAKSEDEENSYEGFYTNVEKLERHLDVAQDKTPGYKYTFKKYIEGVGTMDKAGDELPGYAFGMSFLWWKAGIPNKVVLGLNSILEQIKKRGEIDDKMVVDELAIDVFGFSRGAACARNFIYEALNDDDGQKVTYSIKTRFKHEMRRVDLVKVKFAGLFDTVSTFGVGTVVGAADNVEDLKLDAVSQADRTLHLTSADEHRFHFSLTNIKSAGGKGSEYILPGVHSDIGGGYRDESTEKLTLRGNPKLVGQILHANYISPDEAKRDRQELIAQGWYQEEEIQMQTIRGAEDDFTRVTTDRPGIKNHYSKIPLNIMAREMRQHGLVFWPDFDEKEIVPQGDPVLTKAKEQLEGYAVGASKTSPDEWKVTDRNRAQMDWLLKLRHDYLHFSARMQPGHDPRVEKGERKRKCYDG
jgi:hypothetical protein